MEGSSELVGCTYYLKTNSGSTTRDPQRNTNRTNNLSGWKDVKKHKNKWINKIIIGDVEEGEPQETTVMITKFLFFI